MNNRAGQLEVPINWVFILIAGGIILITFFGFIQKQKTASEQSSAESLISDLSAIAAGAQTAKGTAQLIEFPELDVDFSCEDCDCRYRIGSITKEFGDTLIFGPKTITGPNMVLYSVDWAAPFRVTNFLIATNQRVKYVMAVPVLTPEIRRILSMIPDNINRANATGLDAVNRAKNIRNDGGKLRLVFFLLQGQGGCTKDIPTMATLEGQDYSCLNIDMDHKAVYWFAKDKYGNWNAAGNRQFASDGDLLAAIFTEDFKQYACNMREAYIRLASLADIYSMRAESFNNKDLCGMNYDMPVNALQTLAWHARVATDATNITGDISKLSTMSLEYIRKSCPEIY